MVQDTTDEPDRITMAVDAVETFNVDSNGRIYVGKDREGQTLKCAMRAVDGNSVEDE